MRSKLTPRGHERREQLISCAAGLFAERGYHPTSVADIVAALGVGKGVFSGDQLVVFSCVAKRWLAGLEIFFKIIVSKLKT